MMPAQRGVAFIASSHLRVPSSSAGSSDSGSASSESSQTATESHGGVTNGEFANAEKVADGAIQIDEVKRAYRETLGELEQMKRELDPLIDELENPDDRAVMRLRYIECYSPEDIAEGGETPLRVTANENLGMNTLVHGYLGGGGENRVTAKLRGWANHKAGDTVNVRFTKMHFFDKETTRAIRKEAE